MKRKLIKQGGYGYTIYLPKKWITENKLNETCEVEITQEQNILNIHPHPIKKEIKETTITIPNTQESILRNLVVNAYRTGYDIIKIIYKGNISEIRNLTKNHLIGFDVFQEGKDTFIIKKLAQVTENKFENIIITQFYTLSEIVKNIEKSSIIELVYQIQKYDNFIKRSISKKIFHLHSPELYWQTVSLLAQVARHTYHLHNHIKKEKKKITKEQKEYMSQIDKIITLLRKLYTQKTYPETLSEVHILAQELRYNKGHKLLEAEDSIIAHYLVTIARLTYVMVSPIGAIIQEYKNH